MRPRSFLCITLLLLCHAQMHAQLVTNALPPAEATAQAGEQPSMAAFQQADSAPSPARQPAIPDDPSRQLLPIAHPQPQPEKGVPVRWEALHQARLGDDWTLSGEVVLTYKDFVIHADRVVYHQTTNVIEADGHLQVTWRRMGSSPEPRRRTALVHP